MASGAAAKDRATEPQRLWRPQGASLAYEDKDFRCDRGGD